MPVRQPLVGDRRLQQFRITEPAADELQAGRQAIGRETAWNADGRLAGLIGKTGQLAEHPGTADRAGLGVEIARLDRYGRHDRGGRKQEIVFVHDVCAFGNEGLALAKCLLIHRNRDVPAKQQTRCNVGRQFVVMVAHPLGMDLVGLGEADRAPAIDASLQCRQSNVLQRAAKPLKVTDGGVEDGLDFTGQVGAEHRFQNTDLQAVQVQFFRRHPERWPVPGRGIPVVGSRHGLEDQSAIPCGSSERSGMVEARTQWLDAMTAGQAKGRLQSRNAAQGCRQAHRTTGVGPQRGGHHARRDGACRTRTRTATGTLGIPGIARRCADGIDAGWTIGKFVQAGHADDDRAGLAQPVNDMGIERTDLGRVDPTATGSLLTTHGKKVLDAQGNAVEGAAGSALRDFAFGLFCLGQRGVRIPGEERPESLVATFDPADARLHAIERREPAGSNASADGAERVFRIGCTGLHAQPCAAGMAVRSNMP